MGGSRYDERSWAWRRGPCATADHPTRDQQVQRPLLVHAEPIDIGLKTGCKRGNSPSTSKHGASVATMPTGDRIWLNSGWTLLSLTAIEIDSTSAICRRSLLYRTISCTTGSLRASPSNAEIVSLPGPPTVCRPTAASSFSVTSFSESRSQSPPSRSQIIARRWAASLRKTTSHSIDAVFLHAKTV